MDYAECKGVKHPFLFTWPAFKEWQNGVDKYNELEMFEQGIYLGFEKGAKKEGKDAFSFEEMQEMFGEDLEFQQQAFELFGRHLMAQKKILDSLRGNLQS